VSQSYAIVLVFERLAAADVLPVLAPVMESQVDASAAPLRTALGGRWRWIESGESALGAAIWQVAANSVHRDERAAIERIDRYLEAALQNLSPLFGYFSILESHGEPDWLARVFAQLADDDWDALLKPAYERILLPPRHAELYLDHPGWTVLAQEDAGVLVRTRNF
jgi:hypothetical protein